MKRFSAAVLAIAVLMSACVTETPRGQLPTAKPDLPKAARERTKAGTSYLNSGYLDLAIDTLKLAIKDDDDYAPAHATLGWAYNRRGDFGLAEEEFHKATAADSSDVITRFYLGAYQCERGKYEEGRKNLLVAARNRDFAVPQQAWTFAGLCSQSAKNQAQAESDYMEALRLDPSFAQALAKMAEITYERGDYPQTRNYLQRYERVGPPTPDMLALGVHTERALGRLDSARVYELKLRQNFPDSEEAVQLNRRPSPEQ